MKNDFRGICKKTRAAGYGWIAARKEAGDKYSIIKKGYSRNEFITFAEYIIACQPDPDKYVIVNPKNGNVYRLTNTLYAARRMDYLSACM